MFDSDEDGLLSKDELIKAAQALVIIQKENAEEDIVTEVKGEPSSTEVEGENTTCVGGEESGLMVDSGEQLGEVMLGTAVVGSDWYGVVYAGC